MKDAYPKPENLTTKADVRKLTAHLRDLTKAVTEHLAALDAEMRHPSDHERGKRVALLCNALDYANDQARYFGLGVDFRTDKKRTR